MTETAPLYDTIGGGYDSTRRPDPYLRDRLRALVSPHPGGRYLDLCCGTGNYTSAMASVATDEAWVGLDVSARMLVEAKQKPGAEWIQGTATALPFGDTEFDGMTMVLAMHHLAPEERRVAMAEIARTLKPNAAFVMLTSDPEQTGRYWLREYFPVAMERSAEQLPTAESLDLAAREAGLQLDTLELYEVRPDLVDSFLYQAKNNPARYLDPRYRAGISTFANLADPAEVASGCERLRSDIASGRIDDVRARFIHDDGDYQFRRYVAAT